jgi:hypothetical protein
MSSQPDSRLIGIETSDFKAAFYPIRSAYPKGNMDSCCPVRLHVAYGHSNSSCHSRDGKATVWEWEARFLYVMSLDFPPSVSVAGVVGTTRGVTMHYETPQQKAFA